MQIVIELIKSILYGIVEGITEWLPVSSTGHLILLEEWLPLSFCDDPVLLSEFYQMFQVVIQLGAILAVVVLYWSRLWPFGKGSGQQSRATWSLWFKIVVASIPAAVVGIGVDALLERLTARDIDGWLYTPTVVAVALIVYGVAFIVIERRGIGHTASCTLSSTDQISYTKAFAIGAFQALSIVPGTSRSGSTILGSMLLGLPRTVAAEFSFFMAIPAMAGGSAIKALGFAKYVVQSAVSVPAAAWIILLVGCAVSFLVSMCVIRFLTDFVSRHTFTVFGVYRIVLGLAVLAYFWLLA